MAIRMNVSSFGGPVSMMYLNEKTVGINCHNAVDDVLLVQYLLKKIYQCVTPKPLGRQLIPDGMFGGISHYWLLFFEAQMKQDPKGKNSPYEVQGALPAMYSGKINVIRLYDTPIGAMNDVLYKCYPDSAKELWTQPDLPAMLKTSLATAK